MGQTYLFHPCDGSMGRSSSTRPKNIGFVTSTLVIVQINLWGGVSSGMLAGCWGDLSSHAAASLVSSSALLFGAKLRCPGTQCICKSITPFDLVDNCWCCYCAWEDVFVLKSVLALVKFFGSGVYSVEDVMYWLGCLV